MINLLMIVRQLGFLTSRLVGVIRLFLTAFDLKLLNMKLAQHERIFEANRLRSKQPSLDQA